MHPKLCLHVHGDKQLTWMEHGIDQQDPMDLPQVPLVTEREREGGREGGNKGE